MVIKKFLAREICVIYVGSLNLKLKINLQFILHMCHQLQFFGTVVTTSFQIPSTALVVQKTELFLSFRSLKRYTSSH